PASRLRRGCASHAHSAATSAAHTTRRPAGNEIGISVLRFRLENSLQRGQLTLRLRMRGIYLQSFAQFEFRVLVPAEITIDTGHFDVKIRPAGAHPQSPPVVEEPIRHFAALVSAHDLLTRRTALLAHGSRSSQ